MPKKGKKWNEPRIGLHYSRATVSDGFTPTAYLRADLDAPLAGWTLEAHFTLDEGEIFHGPVTLTPVEPVAFGSLSSTALRRLSLVGLIDQLEDGLRQLDAGENVKFATGWVDALTAGRKPGRRGQDPYVYLVWAQRRVEAERQAPDRPIKWLVEQYGGEPHNYSEQAINKYVFKARDKGFLTPSGEPVDLTPQAKRLLAAKKES